MVDHQQTLLNFILVGLIVFKLFLLAEIFLRIGCLMVWLSGFDRASVRAVGLIGSGSRRLGSALVVVEGYEEWLQALINEYR